LSRLRILNGVRDPGRLAMNRIEAGRNGQGQTGRVRVGHRPDIQGRSGQAPAVQHSAGRELIGLVRDARVEVAPARRGLFGARADWAGRRAPAAGSRGRVGHGPAASPGDGRSAGGRGAVDHVQAGIRGLALGPSGRSRAVARTDHPGLQSGLTLRGQMAEPTPGRSGGRELGGSPSLTSLGKREAESQAAQGLEAARGPSPEGRRSRGSRGSRAENGPGASGLRAAAS